MSKIQYAVRRKLPDGNTYYYAYYTSGVSRRFLACKIPDSVREFISHSTAIESNNIFVRDEIETWYK